MEVDAAGIRVTETGSYPGRSDRLFIYDEGYRYREV